MGKLRSYLTQVQDFIANPISRNVVLNDLYQESLEVLFNDNKESPKEAIVLKVFPGNQTLKELKDGEQQFQSAVLRIKDLHDCIPDPASLLYSSTNGEINNCIQLHGICFSREPLTNSSANQDTIGIVNVGDVVEIEFIDGVPRFGEVIRQASSEYINLQFISEKAEDQNEKIDTSNLVSSFDKYDPVSLGDLVGIAEGRETASDSLVAASKNPLLAGQKIINGKLPDAALYTVPGKKDLSGRPVRVLVEVSDEFVQLLQDFKAHFGYDLGFTDSYRTYERQVGIKASYESQGKGQLAGPPGQGPHGWGLAFDCITKGKDKIKGFDGEIYKWLFVNAPKRGFWNPTWAQKGAKNPKGKSTEEPWHWEVINRKKYVKIFNAIEAAEGE